MPSASTQPSLAPNPQDRTGTQPEKNSRKLPRTILARATSKRADESQTVFAIRDINDAAESTHSMACLWPSSMQERICADHSAQQRRQIAKTLPGGNPFSYPRHL
jgi:hypothetical protein